MKHILLSLLLITSYSYALQDNPKNPSDFINSKNIIENTLFPTVYTFIPKNCDVCIKQIMNLSKLYSSYPNIKIKIVTLSDDKDFKNYMSSFNLKYSVIEDKNGEIISKMKISTIPVYIFVDKKNIVKGVREGDLSSNDLISYSEMLLSGDSIPLKYGSLNSQIRDINGLSFDNSEKNWIVFHASNCPYSKAELPELLEYAKSHTKEKFFILTFGDDKIIEQQFIKIPENMIVFRPSQNNLDIAKEMDITATPTQMLVDNHNIVKFRGEGYISEKGIFSPK